MSSSDPNSCLEADEDFLQLVTECELRQYRVVYENVLLFCYFHVSGVYGLYVAFTSAKWQTIYLAVTTLLPGLAGVTAGTYRLWPHRSYRPHWSLQLLLMLCYCASGQGSLFNWARNHGVHHKHRNWFMPLIAVILPTIIPVQLWGESLLNAWHITMLRYVTNMNFTFMVNSCAHLWGYKPYDKHIAPTVTLKINSDNLTLGKGSHNFHHTFLGSVGWPGVVLCGEEIHFW